MGRGDRKLEMLGTEYVIQKPFLRAALQKLMDLGKAKDHYEALESQHRDWDVLLQKAKEYANRRRLEANDKRRTQMPWTPRSWEVEAVVRKKVLFSVR